MLYGKEDNKRKQSAVSNKSYVTVRHACPMDIEISICTNAYSYIYVYKNMEPLYVWVCVCLLVYHRPFIYHITSEHIASHHSDHIRSHQRRLMDGWTDEGYNNKTNQTSFHSIPRHAIQCTPQNKSQGRIRYSVRKWMSEIESVWKTFAL